MPLPPLPLMTLESWKPVLTVAWYEKMPELVDDDPDDLVAGHRIGAGDAGPVDAGVVQVDPAAGPNEPSVLRRTVTERALDGVGSSRLWTESAPSV